MQRKTERGRGRGRRARREKRGKREEKESSLVRSKLMNLRRGVTPAYVFKRFPASTQVSLSNTNTGSRSDKTFSEQITKATQEWSSTGKKSEKTNNAVTLVA